MPLLNKKPFKPRPVPKDLKPDEEVFVCPYTKEAFRDYGEFFNRLFLCKTFVWSCSLTGQHNLTYEQASASEREARATMDSLPDCLKKAFLTLLHTKYRTSIKTVVDEISIFFKDRYVVGEVLEYITSPGTKKAIVPVRIVEVMPPKPSPLSPGAKTTSIASASVSPVKPTITTPTKVSRPPSAGKSPDVEIIDVESVSSPIVLSGSPDAKATPPKVGVSGSPKGIIINTGPKGITIYASPNKSFVITSNSKPGVGCITKSITIPIAVNPPSKPIPMLTSVSPKSASHSKSSSASPKSVPVPASPKPGSTSGMSPKSSLPSTPTPSSTAGKAAPRQSPISEEASLNPQDYQYLVERTDMASPSSSRFIVPANRLIRPKNIITKEKVRLFLKNALYKDSERLPLLVKQEYIDRYNLGPTAVKFETLATVSPKIPRKRNLSQTSLDGFLTPKTEPKKSHSLSLSPSVATGKTKKSPAKFSKVLKSSSKKGKSSVPSTPKSPKTKKRSKSLDGTKQKSKLSNKTKSASVSSTPAAKKLLKKVKQMKQQDLKKNLINKKKGGKLTEEEMLELKKRAMEEKARQLALKEAEKDRRKEEQRKKKQELREKQRLEKLKQLEWLKPREDNLCEDSKPLPALSPIASRLSPELFGDAVMLLEFMHHYGPLFNAKDVIHGPITYFQLEDALLSCSPDTILFGLIKFLLQTIFSSMGEEHEFLVDLNKKERKGSTDDGGGDSAKAGAGTRDDTKANTSTRDDAGNSGSGSRRSSICSIPVEVEEDRPLDVRLASLKASASLYAQWPLLTQGVDLNTLVLDPYTCTEVLRLHILSSGGYKDGGDRHWFRFCNRGGYTDSDDPMMELRLSHPALVNSLTYTPIYDIPPGDKLRVLTSLCCQLMMFAITRESVDEALIESKRLRKQIRQLQASLSEKKKKEDKSKGKPNEAKEEADKPGDEAKPGDEVKPEDEAKPPDSEIKGGTPKNRSSSPKDLPADKDADSMPKSLGKVKTKTRSQRPVEKPEEIVKEEQPESEEERRARIMEEIAKVECELYPIDAAFNLQPLGQDRHHNTYWMFPSLPGLFVERHAPDTYHAPDVSLDDEVDGHNSTGATSCDPHTPTTSTINTASTSTSPVHVQCNGVDRPCTSRDSIPSTTQSLNYTPTDSPSLPMTHATHQPEDSAVAPPTWYCITTQEELESLIESLNPRGLRESALKLALLKKKNQISDSISRCPILGEQKSDHLTQFGYSTASKYLELYLREQVLDLEEKVYMGNLGYIKEVDSRQKWREMIESSGAAAEMDATEKEAGLANGKSHESDISMTDAEGEKEEAMDNNSVQELAHALLQIQGGIEKKCLLPPLGTATDLKTKRKAAGKLPPIKDQRICLDQWRASLLKSSSLSQVFLHLATLERSIAWSKSLMNVRCRLCRRKGGDEYMLLCDGCDHGYHMYCLRPPLRNIPEGDWYCYNCCPVTPVKRRRTVSTVIVSDSDSESEGEESEESDVIEDMESAVESSEGEEVDSEPKRGLRQSTRLQRKAAGCRPRLRQSNKENAKQNGILTKKKRKGQVPESQLTHSRKKIKLQDDASSSSGISNHDELSKAEFIISSIIDVKCSKKKGPAQQKAQETLEVQLCKVLLDELMASRDSTPFINCVRRREYPDYYDIISHPMDFKTIRQKMSSHKYTNIDSFLKDVHLIFNNCDSYHKRHSREAKAGAALRRLLEQRYSDLGLANLTNISIHGPLTTPELRSRRSF